MWVGVGRGAKLSPSEVPGSIFIGESPEGDGAGDTAAFRAGPSPQRLSRSTPPWGLLRCSHRCLRGFEI